MPTSIYNHQSMKNRRRFLRKNQTEAEEVLWNKLRRRQMEGYKFMRQYSVGPYIIDFYCSKLRLAIEIDGSQHGDEGSKVYDKERDRLLSTHNILTLRFWNHEILSSLDNALKKIQNTITHRAGDPSLAIREGLHDSEGDELFFKENEL